MIINADKLNRKTSQTTPTANSIVATGSAANLNAWVNSIVDLQALGTKNTDYTADFNSGKFITVTTGSGAATLTIPDWASATELPGPCWLYITQGATARTQTFGAASGTNNNIISSGGLMSAGDALPNSGANTTDAFCLEWTGSKWFVSNVLFDVKA